MIIRKFYLTRADGVNLYRNYSDEGFYIIQNETNVEYSEAIDVENAPYTYTESLRLIEAEDEATEADYIEALGRFGV